MWKEPYIYSADFSSLTASSGTAFTDLEMKVPEGAHFEMVGIAYSPSTGNAKIRIIDGNTGRDIIRPAGDIRAICATTLSAMTINTLLRYNFPISHMFPAGSSFIIGAADNSGAGTAKLKIAIYGNLLYKGDAPYINRKNRETFNIMIDSGNVAAYQSVVKSVTMNTDAGFLVRRITGMNAFNVGETGSLMISDKNPWSSKEINFYNLLGNGQYGNVLTSPKWVPEKATINVKFINFVSSTDRYRITLHGERVYI